ncbi:unnamed protein product, partial [Rhizoctonia solani]
MTEWNPNAPEILDKYIPQTPKDPTERLLRALVVHAPTERGRQNVCDDILKCGGAAATGESHLSERLYEIGQYYVSALLVPMLQGDRITRDGWVDLKLENINPESTIDPTLIEEAKRDVKKTKALALVRDDYQCVICGLHDILVYKNQPIQDVPGVPTTAAPILPFHLGRSGESTAFWAALSKFSGMDVANMLCGDNINRLGNVLTITPDDHGLFSGLCGWLEAVEGMEDTYRVCAGRHLFALPIGKVITLTSTRPELELPDPRLIAIHAAIAKVTWSSDTRTYLDRI